MQQQPKNRIPEMVSAELVCFADCLTPSSSYIKLGKEMVQNVFSLLQREPGLSISRNYIGGSVGKSTTVIYPDFDCVVFLNGKYPPLTDMVEKFESILRGNAEKLKIVVNSIKKSSITVSLEFSNGVEMDLLPATSFAQGAEDQYQQVLQRLQKSTDIRQYLGFSSSLAETAIQFMKNQSGPTHQLVRLAKYWYKLCTLDSYIYGGSSIIEIICVDVAFTLNPHENGLKFEMLEAFKLFLKTISNVNTLKIAFYRDNEKKKFVRVAPNEFALPKYKAYFHESILKRKNFIVEPANPFNDLALNIKDASAKRLKEFAEKMLKRLEKLESAESTEMKRLSSDGKNIEFVHYDKLFEPFIMRLSDSYASGIPTLVCVDFYYQNYDTAQVNAKVNKVEFFKKNIAAKQVYRTIMNNLLFIIRGKAVRLMKPGMPLSFTNGIADIKVKEIETAVFSFLEMNFTAKSITVSSANIDHQDAFVTLTVPYQRAGNIYAVRCSMKW